MQPESAPFAVSIAGPPSALASGVLASGPDPLEAPEEPPQAMKAPARVAIADAKFRRPHMAQAGEATREPVERAPVLLGKKRGYRRVGATRTILGAWRDDQGATRIGTPDVDNGTVVHRTS